MPIGLAFENPKLAYAMLAWPTILVGQPQQQLFNSPTPLFQYLNLIFKKILGDFMNEISNSCYSQPLVQNMALLHTFWNTEELKGSI